MVWLTRLNHAPLVLNSDLIEHIDTTPDTVITLTGGQILRVRETAEEVVARIVEFRKKIHGLDPFAATQPAGSTATAESDVAVGDVAAVNPPASAGLVAGGNSSAEDHTTVAESPKIGADA